MTLPTAHHRLTEKQLEEAIQLEVETFQEIYSWLDQAMPDRFFEEFSPERIMMIIHSLMGFHLQEYFSTIHLKRAAIVLCLDSADADLRILKDYEFFGIKNYQAYISSTPPPFPGVSANLRIAQIFFTEAIETLKTPFPEKSREQLRALVKQRNPTVTNEQFDRLIAGINSRFLRSLPLDRLILALDMFFRAQSRDNCQYEVRYNEDWKEQETASMQIVLAWRNTPKHNFLYRLVRIIHRYGLVMKRVNATYINPYNKNNILLMALGLHGSNGEAVWDVAEIPDFLRELVTVKYFASFDLIDDKLVKPDFIAGKWGNFLRAAVNFCHQMLVQIDPYLYTPEKIEEDLCYHPELTAKICQAFASKFDPDHVNISEYEKLRDELLTEIEALDTGHLQNDRRRRHVLQQVVNLIHYTLKTNFFRLNYTALSFRLDPRYLDAAPFDRKKHFPELPFAIFFIKGMHFFGFHIRFRDLSRGGLRTVYPKQLEHIATERDTVFSECYNLAYTQQKKNKDIPEGGAKGVIFLRPWDRLESEALILRQELEDSQVDPKEIEGKIDAFYKEQQEEMLYQSQRSYTESLLTLINCDPNGTLNVKHIIDYYKKPEYLYLGPDENMSNSMIEWIANLSKRYGYLPGSAFISGKPKLGINHKEYGVTSLGVNVYMERILRYLGIDPQKESFTVKMSGGPDGDVAGNQICNLQRHFPKTAKLIALTDISGTIFDPEGLDLTSLKNLFHQAKPISHYPTEKLHEGSFLVCREQKRRPTPLVQQTLCYRREGGRLVEDWLSSSEANHLFRNNVHEVSADIFIPAGGRPRTLNEKNISSFLDRRSVPTARAIIEGANLYLNDKARHFLEGRGVLIVKDSSANKTGVICSSFEILSGLTLEDDLFLKHKEQLVDEILERLKMAAANEADLLIESHRESGLPLTDLSDQISAKINLFTDQLYHYLEPLSLSSKPTDPLITVFFDYCLPTLRTAFSDQLMHKLPPTHKKAIIASHIASQLVYQKGLTWQPSISDVLEPILSGKVIKIGKIQHS